MMRTTLNLPEPVYEVVRSLAAARNISLGQAAAELILKGLHPAPRIDTKTVFPSFVVPEDAPPITLEQTLAAEDEP